MNDFASLNRPAFDFKQKVVQFDHPLGIKPSPIRVRDTGLLNEGGRYDENSRELWRDFNQGAEGDIGIGRMLSVPVLAADRFMQRKGIAERQRQEAINHRLALNNELEDVSEDEAAELRKFLATLRHGGGPVSADEQSIGQGTPYAFPHDPQPASPGLGEFPLRGRGYLR